MAVLLALATLFRHLYRAPCLRGRGLLEIPRNLRVDSGALEPAIGVLAVVERHAMDTEDVGLQVPLLRGTVRTVAALERPVTCEEKRAGSGLLLLTPALCPPAPRTANLATNTLLQLLWGDQVSHPEFAGGKRRPPQMFLILPNKR